MKVKVCDSKRDNIYTRDNLAP